MTKPIQITEAEKTKTVPCRDCGHPLITTKFASPAKTHCGGHKKCKNADKQGTKQYLDRQHQKLSKTAFQQEETESKARVVADKNGIHFTPEVVKEVKVKLEFKYPKSLLKTRCPFCSNKLKIIAVQESMGFVSLECKSCRCNVEIRADWSHMMIHRIPDGWEEIVERFNETQTSTLGTGWGNV